MMWRRVGKILMYSTILGFLFGYVGLFVYGFSIPQVREAVLEQVGFNVLMLAVIGIAQVATIGSAYSIRGIYLAWKGGE